MMVFLSKWWHPLEGLVSWLTPYNAVRPVQPMGANYPAFGPSKKVLPVTHPNAASGQGWLNGPPQNLLTETF